MTAIIQAHDLVKRFDGFTAVDHISFAVPEGVIFGFLGPNGAGKTTTIKMLTTVLTPSGGLDPQTRNQIWEFIRALSRDERVTVFFTTHYMEEAERVAERIAVIDHGRIVAQGTAAALREQTGGRTLEDAFIALTGRSIREADAAPIDRMRRMRQVWLGRR